jgi:hypothetical protein
MTREDGEKATLGHVVAAAIVLIAAAAVRFTALDTTLFEDEVWVANLLRHGNLKPHTYSTPPLFYAIGRLWTALRGFSDVVLREPAAFFGVALCAVPFAAPRPFRTRIVWSTLLAFSSPLLFYSTRLKQYTLEAFVGTILIVFFLHANEHNRCELWVAFFASAVVAATTLYSPIFIAAAAGVIAVLFKTTRRSSIIASFAAVAAAFLAAWLAYLAPGPATPSVHGDMDRFFAQSGRWITSPESFVRNTRHWLGLAFNLVPFWWAVLPPLILWWLIRKRHLQLLMLAAIPPLLVAVASIAHRYPYGEVRLMIFCFPGLYLVTAEALAEVSRRVPIVLLVIAPFIFQGVPGDSYNAAYMHVDDLRHLIGAVRSGHLQGERILADPSYEAPLLYYAPELTNDVRSTKVETAVGPGLYIQQRSTFHAQGGETVAQTRSVVVVRVR